MEDRDQALPLQMKQGPAKGGLYGPQFHKIKTGPKRSRRKGRKGEKRWPGKASPKKNRIP